MIQIERSVATPAHAIDAGRPIDAYTLVAGDCRARILTIGGAITHLFVPDRDGRPGDVVLGYDSDDRYQRVGPYFGALIGRVGNRIADGRFTLDGHAFAITTNEPPNTLHGGAVGYDKRVWTATPDDAATSLTLTLRDPDGHEGFQGNVEVRVVYTLTADAVLRIEYEAIADAATPINLTQHSYFNLRDGGATAIADHVLTLDAGHYTAVSERLVPTGEVVAVAGGPFDFTVAKPIGDDLRAAGGSPVGYDHNFVLNAGVGLRRAARVAEPTTGRTLECWTTEPAVQFYSGNFLDGSIAGKGGVAYAQHSGFCLETQHFPDAMNHPSFPSTILRPGATYRTRTEYRLGVDA